MTPQQARLLQEELRAGLILAGGPEEDVGLVGGADVSFNRHNNKLYAAVVVLSYPRLEFVEVGTAVMTAAFPYIPGLLAFREGPAFDAAWARLRHRPQVVLFDGHGIAHPRGLGIAAHIGVLYDMPTIGVAKRKLVGRYDPPGPQPGDFTPLEYGGTQIGVALRTKKRAKPVFVSPGHRFGFTEAVDFVLTCCRGYKLPEPTRLAHLEANKLRKQDL